MMTKAELIAALVDAPDDMMIYIESAPGILRSQPKVDVFDDMIVIGFDEVMAPNARA